MDSTRSYGRQDFGPSSDYLFRNDWLSSLIGALLCRLGCGRGAPGDRALPGGLLGGAEVVRRMASHEPQRIPMTNPKSKLKAAARATSRSTSKSRSRTRLAPSSSKTAMRPETKHARILAMLRMPAGTTIAPIMNAPDLQENFVRAFLSGCV